MLIPCGTDRSYAERASSVLDIMKITLKLFASLTDYLPVTSKYTNIVELDVPDGATIHQVTEPYKLPPNLVHLVLVNGRYIAP